MTELEDARAQAHRWLSEWDRWTDRKPQLVDALAAAIRIDEATEGGAMVEPDMQPLFEWLHEMLSRLQEGRS